MADTTVSLAEYLQSVLDERDLSIRAFAMYAKVSHSTIRRVLAGENIDDRTLQSIAAYLNLSIETIYRMAGRLPTETPPANMLLDEIETMFRELPLSSQRKIRDIIRLEHQYLKQDGDDTPGQGRKAS